MVVQPAKALFNPPKFHSKTERQRQRDSQGIAISTSTWLITVSPWPNRDEELPSL